MSEFITTISDLLWGRVLIFVLIPIGLWFTIASGFVQFRNFGRMFGILAEGFRHQGDKPTSFQALALSVAGRVGAGNIAGVAVAITLGGPGAIFWMWIVGLVGMATSFFECSIAQLYKRIEPSGDYRGGPAFYIRHGLKKRLGIGALMLAGLYSILLLITFGVAFNILQSYAVSASVQGAFGAPAPVSGVILAVLIGFVIFGGVRRIARVVEIVVPVMAISYIGLVGFILATQITDVPDALLLIVRSAFGLEEAAGGVIGAAIVNGVRRGLFSNEAGLGSAPNVAAVAYVRHPAQQGVVQALSVFIDTLIICTCTASIILLSGVDFTDPDVDGVVLTQNALAAHVGGWADEFIAFALLLFVFSSIMYNYFLGENALDFFVSDNALVFNIFRIVTLGFIILGSMLDLGAAFSFADLTMGLLALVNLLALALLFPIGLRVMRDFDRQRKAGLTPVLDPDDYADLDVDAQAWALDPSDQPLLDAKRRAFKSDA
ncbi:MAG: alanine/glycine:cation symporter family protein [Pseudomonadota bacterium]